MGNITLQRDLVISLNLELHISLTPQFHFSRYTSQRHSQVLMEIRKKILIERLFIRAKEREVNYVSIKREE